MTEKKMPAARVKARNGQGTQSKPNEGSKVTTKANTPQDSPPTEHVKAAPPITGAMLKTGTDAALDFLQRWAPEGSWALTAIKPDKKSIQGKLFRKADFTEMGKWIAERNGKYNMYFSVNSVMRDFDRKASREDIGSMVALHVDIDARPPNPDLSPDQIAAHNQAEFARIYELLTAKLPQGIPEPSVITFSGGGYQAFWKLAEPVSIDGDVAKYEDAKLYNIQLERIFEGDNCHNVDRIMRLPGTVNVPDAKKLKKGRKPTLASIVRSGTEAYSLDRFIKASPVQSAKGDPAEQADATIEPELLESLDKLDQWHVPDRVKIIIAQGHHPQETKEDDSRSAWLFDALCNLYRCKVPDTIVYGIITDKRFGISASVLDKRGNIKKYADRQLKRAKKEAAKGDRINSVPTGAIIMQGGDLVSIVDRAESALLGSDIAIYQRGELVRPARVLVAPKEDDEIIRQSNSLILVPVDTYWLVEKLAKVAEWYSFKADGDTYPADPAPKYANHLLARKGDWKFPYLRAVLSAPTLARDGRIIEAPGYDVASGLLLDIAPGSFPPVPPEPTKAQAKEALAKLAHPLRGFPFVSDAAKAVAISAMLTALVRPSMRTAPLHAFDAPEARSGKSKLTMMPGQLASGLKPSVMHKKDSEEEDAKLLAVILRSGDPVIIIDNCEQGKAIEGQFLCSVLTEESVQARILGLSERVVLPCTAFVMASGNNIAIAGDMTKRTVKSRIDAKMENPGERPFDFDPNDELMAARPELVVAGLTALRAYKLAKDKPKLRPMGGFEDYDWIRGTLVWTGYADPADTRDEIVANDPKKNDLIDVMDAWEEAYRDREVLTGQIVRDANDEQMDAEQRPKVMRLLRLFVEVTGKRDWDSTSVGNWLDHYKDRVIAGRRFVVGRKVHGRNAWRLSLPKSEIPF